MKDLSLIGAASGWGAGFKETEAGPPALRALGLHSWLQDAGVRAAWASMIEPQRLWREHPEIARRQIFEMVAAHNAALAAAVRNAMAEETLPVVLGGDHSIAVGTWGGVSMGLGGAPFGLLWFDAHLDAHTVATTPSMNPHGMSAAVLLGHGEPEFLAVGGGVVRPKNLCYIGARSFEEGEVALLKKLGVRIFFMEEVRLRGLDAVVAEAMARAGEGTRGIGLTIDLDGFDPEDAPGIGLKEPNGLRRNEMIAALKRLNGRADLLAVEIVEYIPGLDHDHRTAHLVRDLLLALLAPSAANAVHLAAE